MRLLNVHTLQFRDFYSKLNVKYIVTSHRWKIGHEAMLEDLRTQQRTDTSGFKKVQGFAKFVQQHFQGIDWLWMDTCCVNQNSDREVSEAVNSMFRWYSQAELCLAYLADVDDPRNAVEFESSEWFRRGWTLQELLAPRSVLFLSQGWEIIGRKGSTTTENGFQLNIARGLESSIALVTQIPLDVLSSYSTSKEYSVDTRLEWMDGRETTREEDMIYSLFGIFDVALPIIYGETVERAKRRLLKEIAESTPSVAHSSVRSDAKSPRGSYLEESERQGVTISARESSQREDYQYPAYVPIREKQVERSIGPDDDERYAWHESALPIREASPDALRPQNPSIRIRGERRESQQPIPSRTSLQPTFEYEGGRRESRPIVTREVTQPADPWVMCTRPSCGVYVRISDTQEHLAFHDLSPPFLSVADDDLYWIERRESPPPIEDPRGRRESPLFIDNRGERRGPPYAPIHHEEDKKELQTTYRNKISPNASTQALPPGADQLHRAERMINSSIWQRQAESRERAQMQPLYDVPNLPTVGRRNPIRREEDSLRRREVKSMPPDLKGDNLNGRHRDRVSYRAEPRATEVEESFYDFLKSGATQMAQRRDYRDKAVERERRKPRVAERYSSGEGLTMSEPELNPVADELPKIHPRNDERTRVGDVYRTRFQPEISPEDSMWFNSSDDDDHAAEATESRWRRPLKWIKGRARRRPIDEILDSGPSYS